MEMWLLTSTSTLSSKYTVTTTCLQTSLPIAVVWELLKSTEGNTKRLYAPVTLQLFNKKDQKPFSKVKWGLCKLFSSENSPGVTTPRQKSPLDSWPGTAILKKILKACQSTLYTVKLGGSLVHNNNEGSSPKTALYRGWLKIKQGWGLPQKTIIKTFKQHTFTEVNTWYY